MGMSDDKQPATPPLALCNYCPHPVHKPKQCAAGGCKCKAKPGFWRGMLDGLGNAIGEAKFGGE